MSLSQCYTHEPLLPSITTLSSQHCQDLGPPDHPALSELGSIADLSSRFRSLTARKMITGGSVTSIDTLIEVNNAAWRGSVRSVASGETETGAGPDTVDFGVI